MKLNFLFIAFSFFINFCSGIKSALPAVAIRPKMTKSSVEAKVVPVAVNSNVALPQALKLVIGAGGIYAAFLYYGTLQEDVFHYKSIDGSKFKEAWFLQALGII
jgi:UDP-galactose transporter B1